MTMDDTGLKVAAYVQFPPIKASDIVLAPYVRCLDRNYWDLVKSGIHDEHTRPLLIGLCQHIVDFSSEYILEAIEPVISDWHGKAQQIYELVDSFRCFFGVDENYVLKNLENILPRCFTNSVNIKEMIRYESLDKFIQLIAKEVTARVNYRIAVRVGSNTSHLGSRTYGCNCISFETLYNMIDLVVNILRCMRTMDCKVTPLDRSSEEASGSSTKDDRENKRPCDVTCFTSNEKVKQLLTGINEFPPETRNSPIKIKVEAKASPSIMTDSDTDYESPPSEVSRDEDEETTDENEQSSDLTDTESENEEDFKELSAENTDRRPSREDQPRESEDVQEDYYFARICESLTLSDDDYKEVLVVLVLTGLVLRATEKAGVSLTTEEFNKVISHFKDKALEKINLANILICPKHQTVKKTCKDLFHILLKQLGDLIWQVQATVSDHNLLIRALETHLTEPAKTKKKKAFARFFPSVRISFKNPFKSHSISPEPTPAPGPRP